MPRIRWSGLPPALRDHLFDRLRERKITAEDLQGLGGLARLMVRSAWPRPATGSLNENGPGKDSCDH